MPRFQFSLKSVFLTTTIASGLVALVVLLFSPIKGPAIPELRKPIVYEENYYLDGGSVEWVLHDAQGRKLRVIHTQNDWKKPEFVGNQLYIGSLDDIYAGRGVLVPSGSVAERTIWEYINGATLRQPRPISIAPAIQGTTSTP